MSTSPRAHAAGSGPPLVLLHGFTGRAEAWGALGRRLAQRFSVIAFDLPGHGGAPAPRSAADGRLPRLADELVRALDVLGVDDACWLGYSLGARVALHVALAHPRRVRALLLESASPGIADAAERRRRAAADVALADTIVRDGLEPFVDAWLAQPLFATQARLPDEVRARERARRLRGSAAGYAAALRAMTVGEQEALWPRLAALRLPVLLVAGEDDVKYRALAAAMAATLPDARLALIAGAGHAVHLEQPRAWLAAIKTFLDGVWGRPTAGAA